MTTDCAEITLADEVHQVNIVISFYFFLSLVIIGVKFIENFAIEIVLFISIVILVLRVDIALKLSTFKLVSIHTSTHFFSDFLGTTSIILLTDHSESLN